MDGIRRTFSFAIVGWFGVRLELGPHRSRGWGEVKEGGNPAWHRDHHALTAEYRSCLTLASLSGVRSLEPRLWPGTLPLGQPRPRRPCVPRCARWGFALLPEPELRSFSALGCTAPAPWPVPKVFASSRLWEEWGREEHPGPMSLDSWRLVIPPAPSSEHRLLVTAQGLSSKERPYLF